MRIIDLIDNQVRSLRKRQVIELFRSARIGRARTGAFGPTSPTTSSPSAMSCPRETAPKSRRPTRLNGSTPIAQERLINWGYAVCDAGMRKHVVTTASAPAGFPYPAAGV